MKKHELFWFLGGLSLVFVLSGCVVRTYPLQKDRIDQDLIGNRGYLQGQAPVVEEKERKTTRTTQVVEIELHSPLKFERMPKAEIKKESSMLRSEELAGGNHGYITSSISPEIAEPQPETFEKYTVQKNDTLQKISKKFYGTTKKSNKIYNANKGVLKSPNSIYPGQVINVPVEGQALKGTKENLK
jgi:LysM repeat protein